MHEEICEIYEGNQNKGKVKINDDTDYSVVYRGCLWRLKTFPTPDESLPTLSHVFEQTQKFPFTIKN